MNALRLIRVEFDGLENHASDAVVKEEIGIFVDNEPLKDGDGTTAYSKISEYLKKLGPVQLYLGWNHKVYPRFEIEEIYLK